MGIPLSLFLMPFLILLFWHLVPQVTYNFQKYSALMRKIRPSELSNYNENVLSYSCKILTCSPLFSYSETHFSMLYSIIAIGNTYFDVHCSEYRMQV